MTKDRGRCQTYFHAYRMADAGLSCAGRQRNAGVSVGDEKRAVGAVCAADSLQVFYALYMTKDRGRCQTYFHAYKMADAGLSCAGRQRSAGVSVGDEKRAVGAVCAADSLQVFYALYMTKDRGRCQTYFHAYRMADAGLSCAGRQRNAGVSVGDEKRAVGAVCAADSLQVFYAVFMTGRDLTVMIGLCCDKAPAAHTDHLFLPQYAFRYRYP